MADQRLPAGEFVRRRQDDWQYLERLISSKRGRNTLSAEQIQQLGTLYRTVTSDLAIARRDYPDERVTAFLNQLLTRTHSFIYQEDVTDTRGLLYYFTHAIPQTFRSTWPFTLAAFLLFLVPFVIGFRVAYINPAVAVPLGLEPARQQLADNTIWTQIPRDERPEAMSQIATNNIRVAILAFGGGITLGLFTLYILINNGLVIGAVLGLAYHYGLGYALTNFIVAHGFVELSVIFMAGGAGMQIGWAVIHPGELYRSDAIAQAGRRAAALVIIGILLLLFSGAIEGFLSPSEAPFSIKLGTGLLTGALMWGYLLFAGRVNRENKSLGA